jgi:hypothetical protein
MMSIRVNVLKGLEKMMIDKVGESIDRCGARYGMDVSEFKDEMIREMGMKVKNVLLKDKVVRGGIVLPWSSKICEGRCEGLRLNHGLYSQCMNMKFELSMLCGQCMKQSEKNDTGKPDHGMYADRVSWEYVDAKGKSPVSYLKVMSKNGWSREQVEEAALLQGVTIDERHFEVQEAKKRGKKVLSDKVIKDKKSRGRPKKEMKVVEQGDEMVDLFAQLQQEVILEVQVPVPVPVAVEVSRIVVPIKKRGETEDERNNRKKLEKLAAKEEARLAQIQVNDDSSRGSSSSSKKVNLISLAASAKKEQDKIAKEALAAEKLAQKELEKAASVAKKELEKIQKEEAIAAKKEQDRLAKEMAIAAKLAQKELDRIQKEASAAEKLAQKAKKTAPVIEVPVVVAEDVIGSSMSSLTCDELEEESDSDSGSESGSDNDSEVGDDEEAVEPFRYDVDGLIYLRSRESNTVYTREQELVGKWNPETKRIELAVEVEEEEGDCSDSDSDSGSDSD